MRPPAADGSDSFRRLAAWSLALAWALAIAHMAPALFVQVWPDTVRDLSDSLALARGERFALHGPRINAGPNLGPAWIWLEAIPLAFSATLTAAALYVSAIASLWLVLLHAAGRAWSDGRLALCLVAGAALPTVGVYQWQVYFQPDWVPTLIVAASHGVVRGWQGGRKRWWIGAFLLLGLAVQLHPTAIFYAPFAALAVAAWQRNVRGTAAWWLALAACIAIWFAPLAFADTVPHASRWQAGGSRIASGLERFHVRDIGTVLATAYGRIPAEVGKTYAAAAGVPWAAWCVLLAFTAAGFLAGLGRAVVVRDTRARLLLAATATLLAGYAIATAVRDYTSFYLGYFLLPLSALSLGLAFESCLRSARRGLRLVGAAAIAACVGMAFLAAIGATLVGMNGGRESRLPLLGDMRHPAKGTVVGRSVSAAARDAFAGAACRHPGTIGVHGDLAYAWAGSAGLDFRLHCPRRPVPVQLFSTGADEAWSLLTSREARALAKPAALEAGGLAVLRVRRALHPPEPRGIEGEWYDFELLRDPRAFGHVTLDARGEPGSVLMVHWLKPFAGRFDNLRVTIGGAAAQRCLATFNSAGYCAPESGPVEWHIEFDTDAPHWVDVYLL